MCPRHMPGRSEEISKRDTLFNYKVHVKLKDELGGGDCRSWISLFVHLSVAMLNKSFSTFHNFPFDCHLEDSSPA